MDKICPVCEGNKVIQESDSRGFREYKCQPCNGKGTVPEDKIREELAMYAHKAWTGWMDYLFKKSTHNNDGTVTIPKWAVERWMEQCATPYNDLSETEKNSDRSEADGMLKIISRDEEIEKLKEFERIDKIRIEEGLAEIKKLRDDRKELIENIKYFVDRVEAGTIRSRKTYAIYKNLLSRLKDSE